MSVNYPDGYLEGKGSVTFTFEGRACNCDPLDFRQSTIPLPD